MAEQGFDVKRRLDGSIDFDAYRNEAARARSAARQHVIWEVVLPFCWNAPSRLASLLARVSATRLWTGHQTRA